MTPTRPPAVRDQAPRQGQRRTDTVRNARGAPTERDPHHAPVDMLGRVWYDDTVPMRQYPPRCAWCDCQEPLVTAAQPSRCCPDYCAEHCRLTERVMGHRCGRVYQRQAMRRLRTGGAS